MKLRWLQLIAATLFGAAIGMYIAPVRPIATGVPDTRARAKRTVSNFDSVAGPNAKTGLAMSKGAVSVMGSARNAPLSDELRKDMEEALSKRAEGHYVLDSDIAVMRLRNDEQQNHIVEVTVKARGDEYGDLFASLGLDEATSAQLREHLAAIYKAKAQAGQVLTQLVNATTAYDERVESLLGSRYSLYRETEAAYPSRREYTEIQKFAASAELRFNPDDKVAVERMIQKFEAYSLPTLSDWSGPYQSILAPFGGKAFAPTMEALLSTLGTRVEALVQEARSTGISSEALAVMESYYDKRKADIQRAISNAQNPGQAYRESLSAQLAQARSNANTDPAVITKLEGMLKMLDAGRSVKR